MLYNKYFSRSTDEITDFIYSLISDDTLFTGLSYWPGYHFAKILVFCFLFSIPLIGGEIIYNYSERPYVKFIGRLFSYVGFACIFAMAAPTLLALIYILLKVGIAFLPFIFILLLYVEYKKKRKV